MTWKSIYHKIKFDVVKVDGNNTYSGSNIIRLLKEKTVTQIVEIN